MFPKSEITINVNQSKDYNKLLVLLYFFTAVILLKSSLAFNLLLVFYVASILLICPFIYSKLKPSSIKTILFRQGRWIIQQDNGKHKDFDELTICFSTGFFLILLLSNSFGRQKLILFHDQIDKDSRRFIQIISKAS